MSEDALALSIDNAEAEDALAALAQVEVFLTWAQLSGPTQCSRCGLHDDPESLVMTPEGKLCRLCAARGA